MHTNCPECGFKFNDNIGIHFKFGGERISTRNKMVIEFNNLEIGGNTQRTNYIQRVVQSYVISC